MVSEFLRRGLSLAFGALLSAVGGAQTLTVQAAAMPAGLAPLPMTVHGRVQQLEPGRNVVSLLYQWPGTYFEASFRGPDVFFATGSGRQALRVTVDGVTSERVVSTEAGTFHVGGLGVGLHVVRLAVVSESQAGPDGFLGFAVPADDVLSGMAKRTRQIEFIGDSYTVGYGNTSATPKCTQEEIWSRTDDSQAFGPLLARAYGADYQVNAISGRGVVRNYDGFAGDTIPTVYPYVLFNKKVLYRDAQWQPQVVVVGLGTNDFSTQLHASEPWKTREALHAAYEAGLVSFLERLRQRDPQALLVLWATDGAQGEIQAEMGKVADQMKTAGERNLEFVPIEGLRMTGCDGHPSSADDEVIAAKLAAVIDAHSTAWQMPRTVVSR